MLVRVLIAVGGTMLVAWFALLVFLWLARPERARLAETARLLPDTIRLLRRIAADRSVPRGARIRLWLLLAYLAFPIDVVPDFIPILGYADDVVIVTATLRSVVRRAGADAVRRLWRLARLPGEP
jgi:uncharacterized membrane protein YkvA (DUF1232 family)